MQIRCMYGYFMFRETRAGQISSFANFSGFEFKAVDDYYTFSFLEDAPGYSILGGAYLGAPCIKTFEGKPWEIMRANKLIYDFTIDAVVPIAAVIQSVRLGETANYFVSNGMIIPGSVTEDGSRVTDYSAFYLFDTVKFRYSEVSFE